MNLGGVLQAGAEILARADILKRPLSECLKDWGAAHRFAGAKDRAAIGTLCYDALRHYLSLQYKIDSAAPLDIIYGAVFSLGYSPEALALQLAGDKFAPPPPDPARALAWRERRLADAPAWVRADIPQWRAPSLAQNFGENWAEEGAALAERPPLDLRVNALKAGRPKLAARLKEFSPRPLALSPQALRIAPIKGLLGREARHPNLQAEAAFQKGWFEIQDAGSQAAARLCAAKPQEQILDYCAGGGGKTLALAAEMQNRGQIHAYDVEKPRLAPVYARIKRAGLHNIQVHESRESLAPLLGRLDCVLLDAPCSGSGVWRRHPDTKWRLTEQRLEQILPRQAQVLAEGAAYVKPGGRLIYITCSLFYEENDAQIERFLAENSDFQLKNMRDLWAEAMAAGEAAFAAEQGGGAAGGGALAGDLAAAEGGIAEAGAAPQPHFTPFGLLLSPRQTGTDGFFVSALERRGS